MGERDSEGFEEVEIAYVRIKSHGTYRTWKFNKANEAFTLAIGLIGR